MLKRRLSWFEVLRLYQQQQLHQQSLDPVHASGLGTELLGKLNAEERNLILLRAIDEYSYEEIAHIVGCKAATVRKRYERARKKLKALCLEMEEPHETE